MYDKGGYHAIKEDINIDWDEELRRRYTVNEKWNFISKKLQISTEWHILKCKAKKGGKLKYKTLLESLVKLKNNLSTW